MTFEEPDNWELEKGTLNQTELATGKVVAVRDMVTLEQTLSKPIASKTKLIVKATRTDSSSKPHSLHCHLGQRFSFRQHHPRHWASGVDCPCWQNDDRDPV